MELVDAIKDAEVVNSAFLTGSYIDEIHARTNCSFQYSYLLADSAWNTVTDITADAAEVTSLIDDAKSFYIPRGRNITFYLNKDSQQNHIQALIQRGFSTAYYDAWMFCDLKNVPTKQPSTQRRYCVSRSDSRGC